MTTSRSALLGILISFPIILGLKLTLISLGLIIFFLALIYYLNLYFGYINFSNLSIPNTLNVLFTKIVNIDLIDIGNFPRIKIWRNTINLILRKPLIGYGAGFSHYFIYFITIMLNIHTILY